ncbi:hypothetical protein BMS3Bbin14_01116 [bacterium BMS3Bbin14]|nr:hypothetical protein BMS3Abin13_00861 [bacterium BMS3Abin13]GBE52641.1 hypothetical protein BMS3Bbin14_01116 [bacterium BMS3Bbin14]
MSHVILRQRLVLPVTEVGHRAFFDRLPYLSFGNKIQCCQHIQKIVVVEILINYTK